jgi:hypothetical protein
MLLPPSSCHCIATIRALKRQFAGVEIDHKTLISNYCMTAWGEMLFHKICIVEAFGMSLIFVYIAVEISKSMLKTMQKRKKKQYYTIFQTGNNDYTLKASKEEITDTQHGLSHKRGNHSKPELYRNLFRVFVDAHRIPNGKTSSSIKYFLEPSIKRIAITKTDCADPKNSLSSRFAQFIQTVQEIGRYLLK